MSGHYCVILTTTDDKKIAEQIARLLIEKNLAACSQIDRVESYYKWEGEIKTATEFRIMIKTKAVNYSKIEQEILAIHNYSLPQIIQLDINQGLTAYLQWIDIIVDKKT